MQSLLSKRCTLFSILLILNLLQEFECSSINEGIINPEEETYEKEIAFENIQEYDVNLKIEMSKIWPEDGPGNKTKEEMKNIGEISDVAVRGPKDIYIIHRGDHVLKENSFTDRNVYTGDTPIRQPVIVHLVNGKINESFGDNMFFMPHSITVDEKENIWITDIALHQVLRFSKNDRSKPDLIIGAKMTPGRDENHFCKPTDVAVASDGTFFVTDGYCNSRVLKFDKDGKFLKEWGTKLKGMTEENDPYNLLIPHAIELIEEKDLVAVADREHGRVVFYGAGLQNKDATGIFIDQIIVPGESPLVYGVSINDKFGDIYVLSSQSITEPMHVEVYSSSNLDFKYFINPEESIGWAHEISSCPPGSYDDNEQNCLAIASLMESCLSVYDCIGEIGQTNKTAVFMLNIKESSVSFIENVF